MKVRQESETTFFNPGWDIRVSVIGAPDRPGYLVVVSVPSSPGYIREPHYCETLRDAVMKAMDIAGV